ncbi:DUF4282 domain-containing protein [Phenylobacterium sp.]|uniref:DUF4282 domain-containing protein n=1 Tax=Phenylobacterium sp. TaxID=1871053 RepID=UPI002733C85A|nr:DUF4282 domain-containing protein [Phenylobacterium sp.]MDP3660056.1 DUF4282 domain-containing protein [Phenylobacterium sp.]
MRRPQRIPKALGHPVIWDFLTFERLVTGTLVHLIYWAGLGIIVLGAFGTVGAAVGVALREASILGVLLAIPVLIGGLLVMGALALIWRAACEFYVAIFRISEDLHAMRLAEEAAARPALRPAAPRPEA